MIQYDYKLDIRRIQKRLHVLSDVTEVILIILENHLLPQKMLSKMTEGLSKDSHLVFCLFV